MQVDSHPRSVTANACRRVRQHPRSLFSVPITIHHLVAGGVRPSRGISLDLSEGGMGALVQVDLTVGEAVEIDLPLPGTVLNLVAIVRYNSDIGSGFEFLGLKREERLQISSMVGSS